MQIYPYCPLKTRTIEVGGLTKVQLIQKLERNFIMMNEYGKRLLSDERFKISNVKYNLETVELTVRNLGLPNGGTTSHIFKRARELGLVLCPLELGPYLRLEYRDQTEGGQGNSVQNQAPVGSVTIASEILSANDEFPKGFYLRRLSDGLWLRGYVADDLHIWDPGDHFIFCKAVGV
ncbi:helicase [Bacillus suaedae]|uniref:Helicase n=1 Tax=Halalkalibacter suaedae TaxID=2822140 RepID=A0A940WWL2_9BACI|nr:helicase [Bacillus suaedae]MBP3951847.1 helicase [Bacillus suaedae]